MKITKETAEKKKLENLLGDLSQLKKDMHDAIINNGAINISEFIDNIRMTKESIKSQEQIVSNEYYNSMESKIGRTVGSTDPKEHVNMHDAIINNGAIKVSEFIDNMRMIKESIKSQEQIVSNEYYNSMESKIGRTVGSTDPKEHVNMHDMRIIKKLELQFGITFSIPDMVNIKTVNDLETHLLVAQGKTPGGLKGLKGKDVANYCKVRSKELAEIGPLLAEIIDGNDIENNLVDAIDVDSNNSKKGKKEQYKEYLKSKHWKTLSRLAKERDEYACMVCGWTMRLQVHHRTYARCPYMERLSDLVTLCSDCHKLFSQKGKLKKST